ncbi:MAG: ABC transporter permease [Planctomycetota bacterium]|nr:ABC transporter permease [Planctomycetota bacterium]
MRYLVELARSLVRHKPLVSNFVDKDLRGRYIGSTVGLFWSLVNPVLSLATYTFVFNWVLKSRWSDYQPDSQVVLMMYLGIIVWGCHAEIISRCTNTLVENGNLIKKVVFPSEILPSYIGISALVNMGIGLAFVVIGVLLFGYAFPIADPTPVGHVFQPGEPVFRPFQFGLSIVTLPLLIALHLVFSVGLGFLLSTMNLLLRDVGHFVSALITVWMFGTPIFYPESLVRDRGYGWIVDCNPMAWVVDSYREVVLFGGWPDALMLVKLALVAFLSLWAGTRFFFKNKRRFADML